MDMLSRASFFCHGTALLALGERACCFLANSDLLYGIPAFKDAVEAWEGKDLEFKLNDAESRQLSCTNGQYNIHGSSSVHVCHVHLGCPQMLRSFECLIRDRDRSSA